MHSVDPKLYDEKYYLTCCGGYEKYCKTYGRILDKRQEICIRIAGEVKPGQKILDIGCGRGELLFSYALKGCELVGIDYSKSAIEISHQTILQLPKELRKNVELHQMDAKKMNFKDETFDIIFLVDVIEHLYNWELKIVFDKCKKCLKKGGKIVIHTSPTLNYIKYGHLINRLITLLIARKDIGGYERYFKKECEKRHINIHSKESTKKLLSNFDDVNVWYEFLDDKSLAKKLLKKTPLVNILACEMFAVAHKI